MDELSQLEDELRDDSTSCTSSLATTVSISEDTDDLHLGAEANSFDFGFSKQDDQPRSSPSGSPEKPKKNKFSLIVMKELYSSIESTETNRTFSSITSVVDLLNAREGDVGEMLAGLGFSSQTQEYNKRDILSRFKPSPLLSNDDNDFLDFPPNKDKQEFNEAFDGPNSDVKESINKAEEWLALRHEDEDGNDVNQTENTKNSTSKLASNSLPEQTSASGKRGIAQRTSKLRRRFSKSRQSSFELLLPNLKEEDSNPEGEPPEAAKSQNGSAVYSPIRESSLEHSNSVAHDLPAHTGVTEEDFAAYQERSSPSSSPIPALFERRFSPKPSEVDRATGNLTELNVCTTRHTKASLLLSNQLESFELEEINSNEDGAECQKQRRHGVVNRVLEKLDQTNHDDRPLTPSSGDVSDENETSSGFDEEEMIHLATVANHNNAVTDDVSHHVTPHTVVESVQTVCWCGSNPSMQPQSSTTRYVFDVPLGANYRLTGEGHDDAISKLNANNNASAHNSRKPVFANIRSKSFGSLPSHYLPLRCGGISGSKSASKCVVTPLPTKSLDDNSVTSGRASLGKCRLMSEQRRRRKEFAGRSALSGDSIGELFTSSSLVNHNGGYAIRKRRPGCFHYYGNVNDFKSSSLSSGNKNDANQTNIQTTSQISGIDINDNEIESGPKMEKDETPNERAISSRLKSNSETAANGLRQMSLSKEQVPVRRVSSAPQDCADTRRGDAVEVATCKSRSLDETSARRTSPEPKKNNKSNSHRKKLTRQHSVTSPGEIASSRLHFTNPYCGQCYG